MLPRKTTPAVEGHIQRIATDSDGDCHLDQEDGNAIFVPRLVGTDSVGWLAILMMDLRC